MPAPGLAVVTGTTPLLFSLQGGSGCWDFLGAACQGAEVVAGSAGRQGAGLWGRAAASPEGPKPPTLSCLKGKLGVEVSCQM